MIWWLIGLGSLLGGSLRAILSLLLPVTGSFPVPLATLLVNVSGAFAIGLYAGMRGPGAPRPASESEQQFVMAGLCGGYTTFSIFSLEWLTLASVTRPGVAVIWGTVSVTLWLLATWLGLAVAGRYHVHRD